MSEMPEWLEDELLVSEKIHFKAGLDYVDRIVYKAILRQGFLRCFELMQAQQMARPMETAPKDGTRFIAYNIKTFAVSDCRYNKNICEFVMGDGHISFKPTHWLPLPSVGGVE